MPDDARWSDEGRLEAERQGAIPGAIGKEKWGVLGNEPAEMEAFKRDIDLRQFAASLGYAIDRRESWRGSTVLRRGADKIVIKRNGNGHYVYFSVRDERDNGTIIDFVQRRQNLSLGGVRQFLRPWIGRSVQAWFPRLEPVHGDQQGVQEAYRHMTVARCHGYLEQERGVPAEVLSAPRFADRVRQDGRGNVVFPHFDAEGLCGYEIKNRGFTGFAAGGEKGLWCSHTRAVDRRLVVTESAIDALSYAALFPDAEDCTRYASLGGKPSAKQERLMQTSIAKLPEPAEIVAAFDADAPGRLLARVVCDALAAAVAETQRRELTLKIHLPAEEGEDWNDVLQRRIGRRKGASST